MFAGPSPRAEETPKRSSGAWKAKHNRILGAALDEFIDRGFNGASMDRIAAKAKVSKVTIYNHFENKDLLYRQMIEYYVTQVHPPAPKLDSTGTPEEVLCRYASSLIDVVANSRAIGMIRLLRASPESFAGAAATAATPGAERRLMPDGRELAEYLASESTAGRLSVPVPEVAARQFVGMLFENTLYPALMGLTVPLTGQTVKPVVDSCVSLFLAHYGK